MQQRSLRALTPACLRYLNVQWSYDHNKTLSDIRMSVGMPRRFGSCRAGVACSKQRTSPSASGLSCCTSFIRLADVGIHGNSHVMMLEKNSRDIAVAIVKWLETNGPKQ